MAYAGVGFMACILNLAFCFGTGFENQGSRMEGWNPSHNNEMLMGRYQFEEGCKGRC
jgi:hypothetical protein